MLRLLRRLDAFLGTDASEPQNLHKRLYVWFDILTLPSLKAIKALNIRSKSEIIKRDEVLQVMQNFKKLSNIFDSVEAKIQENYRVQFVDALLCHIYKRFEWIVTQCMSADSFSAKNKFTTTITTERLVRRQSMDTREEVLEYALCNNTEAFWDGYDDRR